MKRDISKGARLLVLTVGLLSACGFHLRGTGQYEMSPALATLRVMVQGNQLQNDPLLVAMKNAIRTQTDVKIEDSKIEDSPDVPTLLLFGEKVDNQVLSVSSTAKASQYLLRYEVSFRLLGKENKPLSEPQTVRLQRDYTFDRLNVLAMEREQTELQGEMQRDAVQQILRRLSRIVPENGHADQP
jgi:LPS-assembly lipoprotein